ncbi:MAG: epoxyqueuosine reductase QueH [Treponemataceae bacterium]|nr:epoxyqueuosine reductase QueH [Treponemataceae bacterium]
MQNYAQWLSAKIEELQKEIFRTGKKPLLLLHACCAPCSSYVLEYLHRFFEITIFYYNPNIHPQTEFARRLNELKNFLPKFSADADGENFNLVEAEYFPKEFFDAVQAKRDNLQNERERGERCFRCYKLRMERAFDFAQKNKFDFFTTTLSISPHKDAQKINEIGAELEKNNLEKIAQSKMWAENFSENQNENSCEKNSQNVAANFHTKYLYADFKKQNGFKRSLELSKKYELYRQDYCGCIYSKENLR